MRAGLRRVSGDPRAAEPAAAGDRRGGRRLERGGAGAAGRDRGAGARPTASADVRRLTRAELLAREPQLSPQRAGRACWCRASTSSTRGRRRSPICGRRWRTAPRPGSTRRCRAARWRTACGRSRPRAARSPPERSSTAPACTATSSSSACSAASAFTIRPRKGQFVVFDKAAAPLLRTIILPVPSERTKGVVLDPHGLRQPAGRPDGRGAGGSRPRAVDHDSLRRALIRSAVEMVPALAGMPVTATYAGLRPATERKEYRIRHEPERQLAHRRRHPLDRPDGRAGPGPPCARAVPRRRHATTRRSQAPVWPRMPNLAEHRERDWAAPGHGGIVCHCELVTPPRDRGGAGRAAAGPRPRRAEAPDAGRHGPLPGLLLRRRAGGADTGPAGAAARGRRLPWLSLAADVAIIGGGPAGLAAAMALRRRGVGRVIVLEREAAPAACRAIAAIRPSACASSAGCSTGPGLCPAPRGPGRCRGRVDIRTGHSVVALEPGGAAAARHPRRAGRR